MVEDLEQLTGLLDKTNIAGSVSADTAYRSRANEEFLTKNGFVSQIRRKQAAGGAMPGKVGGANARKSEVRSRVEHVFAARKDRMDLFIRTVGVARAKTKIAPT